MPTQMAPRKSGVTRATSKKYTKRKRNTEASVLDIGESSDVIAQGEIPPTQPTKKKGRGPGNIRQSTEVVEDRPIVWPVGNCEFSCIGKPKEIKAAITR